ncbi:MULTISPECIES: fimbrial protein [Providencia]|uniref:PapA family protein n=1 Tax=Providencia heimbachae ATCC 35613 TaxID=1354272 RepID=A0A1B7JWB0_9GAMM|nr:MULTISPECIES: fimbrial protein [Providencia]MBP6123063.1 type 1 fimbrial protein [Providencia sp.]MDD9341248.1 fimbrial protein [Providencia heimbachae]NIH24066.1 type 1 fimbrial protein [Providencia heimbachae]OAT52209.1 PapA family protein [Providencia heimbachae ATCC 35613]QCJ71460.1 type 1 fimbrial protein [Providencia heimbachae]
MKLNKCMSVLGAALLATSFASLADVNVGTVTFKGEVRDTPCNLDAGQGGTATVVDFGQLSLSQLNDGDSKYKNFDLNLKGCQLTSVDNSDPANPVTVTKTASITFDGVNKVAGQNLLATTGSAANVAVGIQNITFGTASPLNLRDGDNTLTYSAFVKKAGAAAVTAGDFTTISTFEISYQ